MNVTPVPAILTLLVPFLATAGVTADPEHRQPPMAAYTETIPDTQVTLPFVPIPGGRFMMGSPQGEADRQSDEGPRVPIAVEPFWMMKYEVTWRQYRVFMRQYERFPCQQEITPPRPEVRADAVSFPTPLYDTSVTYHKGTDADLPAVSMTPFAAQQFTRWLSLKTGRYYRLPTEAEWEYACRAGSTTAYDFGDDAAALPDHAWFFDNALDAKLGEAAPRPVGLKKPNAWVLFDMLGNVAEIVLDHYVADRYARLATGRLVSEMDAVAWPNQEYPHVIRGGSFLDDPEDLRCARRFKTGPDLKKQDPQIPQSIWWFTDASHIGFRVVRPRRVPNADEQQRCWAPCSQEVREVLEIQRTEER
jgi:formylglycine-generating enzyme required for sulfatase activity